MNKTCSRCKVDKNITEFYTNKTTIDGFYYHCKQCHKLGTNKVKARSSKLTNAYGITSEDFDSLAELSNNTCYICEKEETVKDKRSGETRKLAVDHDHKNHVIRGILCSKCNRGLGMFNDNTQLLEQAIDYLTRYKEALKEHHAAT